uniref:Transposase domain-containing protein n=1 Tax=Amphimedon queenslandica TaxID=400682 RepID=A0A1X7UUJ2_AMPQE
MATSRGPYRTYLYDASKSIPRTTSWRINRKREISELEDSPPPTAETTPPDECSSRQLLNDDLPTTTSVTVDFDAECNSSITPADSEDETNYDYDSDNFETELMEAAMAEDIDTESIVEDLDQSAYHMDDDLLLPLYPDSQISICGAILAIMSFKRECRLPFSTINRLLVLLKLLCPTDSKLPKSVYMLRKMFKSHHCTTVKKYFCSQCKKECNRSDSCSNDDCNSCLENDTFIKLDLQKQFKAILSRHWNDINYIKRDIADANISAATFLNYDKEYFCCPENVGVILNTDGISIFRSSKVSVWPIYLEVANFPPPIRFRIDNTIICGLWVGQSKPEMDIVMGPILKEIDELNMLGFSFSSPDGVKTVRAKLLFGVFDLVAKSKVLNMNQFNGNYGCPICLHPGEYRERRRIYATDKLYPLRTEEGIEDAIQKATTDNTVVQGIKGQSPLYGYLNLVDGVPPDYMHCVLEGVTNTAFYKDGEGKRKSCYVYFKHAVTSGTGYGESYRHNQQHQHGIEWRTTNPLGRQESNPAVVTVV